MSKYTLQLRQIVDAYGEEEVFSWFEDYNLSDYLTQEEIAVIEERGTWSKRKLSTAIIDHYYIREIGLETPTLFKHQVRVAMREIMEEKAPLIYSAAIKFDPLVNVDFTESFDRTSSNTGSSQSASSGLSVSSETPQGRIDKNELLAGKYATSTGADSTTDQTSSTGNGTENYVKRIKGNSGVSATAQKMVEQYRDIIITINRDIIKELGSLFMGIY